MEFTQDIIYKTDQRYVFDRLQHNKVFSRFIDLLIFSISIGIVYDERREVLGEERIEIARNTLMQPRLRKALNFLFQTAVLTNEDLSKIYDDDTRMQLAFDDDFKVENFDRLQFLLEFAPFGLDMIEERVLHDNPGTAIDNLEEFLEELFQEDLSQDIMADIIGQDIDMD